MKKGSKRLSRLRFDDTNPGCTLAVNTPALPYLRANSAA